MDFTRLIARLADLAREGDGKAVAALFTEDGLYEDGFHGAFRGREAIAHMIDELFLGASEDLDWQFFEPVEANNLGYARYLFSYTLTLPEAKGKRVMFEGMSRFVLKDGKIRHYWEIFDRGVALSQLDFAPERVAKILKKEADRLRSTPEARPHLVRET